MTSLRKTAIQERLKEQLRQMLKWSRQTGPGGVGSPAQIERMVPSSHKTAKSWKPRTVRPVPTWWRKPGVCL